MQQPHQNLTGHIAALFTVILWGSTFISTKVLLRSFGPVEILFFRFLLGYLALWLACPHRLKGLSGRQELLFAGAGLSGVMLHYLLENIALNYTSASNAGILASVSPLFTALFAFFLLKSERPGPNFFVGFAFALAGIVLITLSSGEGGESSLFGDLLVLVSAAAWGFYAILTRKIGEWDIDPILMTRRIFAYGLLFMLPTLPVMGFAPDWQSLLTPTNLFNMTYLGVGASAACFATWNVAVRHLGAVKTSSYLYTVPLITVAASTVILNERPTPMVLAGAGLTLMGLVLSEHKSTGKIQLRNS